MLHVQMAFACEEVDTTGRDDAPGAVTFKNVIDGMAAPEFPVTTGRLLAIFCFFSDEPQRVSNCHVVIEHEKGELVAQRALKDLTFAPDSPISRNIVSFNGLVWPYPGGYLVRFVAGRDEVLAHFPLWVRHLPASSEPEP